MEPMNLIWCRRCPAVYPALDFLLTEEELASRDICQRVHGAGLLRPIANSFVSDKPDTEPVRTIYFYALDEEWNKWVVKKWRESIMEPFRYEVFQGEIRKKTRKVFIQKALLCERLEKAVIGNMNQDRLALWETLLVNFLKGQKELILFRVQSKKDEKEFRAAEFLKVHVPTFRPESSGDYTFLSDSENPLRVFVTPSGYLRWAMENFCSYFFPAELAKTFVAAESEDRGALTFVGAQRAEIYGEDGRTIAVLEDDLLKGKLVDGLV